MITLAKTSFQTPVQELVAAFKQHYLWLWLGLQDIKLRYRRSVLGPWWLTISTGLMVGTLGVLYAKIFKVDVSDYLPYFATGHVIWVFIAAQLNEAVEGFVQATGVLKQIRIPLPTCLMRLLMRNLMILAHNSLIVLLVVMCVGHGMSWTAALAIPGLIVASVAIWATSILIAVFCTRFRDFGQVVASLLQIAFFMTPIMWKPGVLGRHAWAATINPLYDLISIIREPILGTVPSLESYSLSVLSMLIALALAYWIFARCRLRITFWL